MAQLDSISGAGRGADYAQLRPKRQRVDPFSGGIALRRPRSTDDRLILPFFTGTCCGVGTGLEAEVRATVPAALAARGVEPDKWQRLMKSLELVQLNYGQSICYTVALILSLIGVPLLCWQQGQYHTALQSWVEGANAELAPHGVFAKFQQVSIHADKYHEEVYWLALALDAEEAEYLRSEPVFWSPGCDGKTIGPNPCAPKCCTCCCGVQRVV